MYEYAKNNCKCSGINCQIHCIIENSHLITLIIIKCLHGNSHFIILIINNVSSHHAIHFEKYFIYAKYYNSL